MRIPLVRVLTALMCEPWAIDREMHMTLTDIAKAHAFSAGEAHAKAQSFGSNPKKRDFAVVGSTAVIPVEGVIGRKYSDVLHSSGVTSVDILERMINAACDDDEINSALLVFDTPGGIITGVPEAAQAVARLSAAKPVIAYADGGMNSAGYWIGSQADAIYGMQSARVGSVGVYLALLDQSRAAEMAGLKVMMFKSGEHKGAGQPGTSLTDAQKAKLQADVDRSGALFRQTVREGRARAMTARDGVAKPISDDVLQGQSFDSSEALANGLIDEVCNLETALADVVSMAKMRR